MGEVYRARDTRLERTVALKILRAQLSSDPARKQRFERQAKTISSLNHPHICTLHDIGSQHGVDYLVMECVEGETLAKVNRPHRQSLLCAMMKKAPAMVTKEILFRSVSRLSSFDNLGNTTPRTAVRGHPRPRDTDAG